MVGKLSGRANSEPYRREGAEKARQGRPPPIAQGERQPSLAELAVEGTLRHQRRQRGIPFRRLAFAMEEQSEGVTAPPPPKGEQAAPPKLNFYDLRFTRTGQL